MNLDGMMAPVDIRKNHVFFLIPTGEDDQIKIHIKIHTIQSIYHNRISFHKSLSIHIIPHIIPHGFLLVAPCWCRLRSKAEGLVNQSLSEGFQRRAANPWNLLSR